MAAVAACGDEGDERLRFAELAEGCSINSDCYGDLVCVFERCHVECNDDDDCETNQRCVRGQNGVNVCQLPDDVDCAVNADCREAQRCAEDRQCRDRCDTNADCVTGQRCTMTGSCVSPPIDDLDGNGELESPASGGSAGSAGRGGTGGRGGSDAAGSAGSAGKGATNAGGASGAAGDDAGGVSGSGGGAGATNAGGSSGDVATGAGGDAGETHGAGGSPGSGAVAGAFGDAGEPGSSGGVAGTSGGEIEEETEPNDTRNQATQVTPNEPRLGAISTPEDVDYYEFSTPPGAAGGYFRIAVVDVAPIVLTVRVYSTANDDDIYSEDTDTSGASHFGYFAAAPNASYRVAIARWSGSVASDPPYSYTLRVDYTPVDDAFEPNDTRLTAAPISLDSPETAYCFAGFASSTVAVAAFADWYEVELVSGSATITLPEVPLDVSLTARLYDSFGAPVGNAVTSAANGAGIPPFQRNVPSDGIYYLSVLPDGLPWSGGNAALSSELPDHFTRPYVIQITQP